MLADSIAPITKIHWKTHEINAENLIHYLGHTCVGWVQKYVRYGQEVLGCKDEDGRIPMGIWDLRMRDLGG